MNMSSVACRNLPGSTISVEMFQDNPALEPGDEKYYVEGYTEIIVRSDGTNRHFPVGDWRILLVSYKDGLRRQEERFDTCTLISINPDMYPTKVETSAEHNKGIITIHLWSDEHGQEQIVLFCDEEPERLDKAISAMFEPA